MPLPDWSAGALDIPKPPRICFRPTCSSTRCGGAFTPGRAFASTSNTCHQRCARLRSPWTRTTLPITTSGSSPARGGAENLLELVRSRDLELVVAAVVRRLVGPPAQKHRGVTKAIALQVVVLDLAHTLDPQRLPREILAGAPAALSARHARHLMSLRRSPFAPRM